jgi:prolyl oligopeptidase
MTAAATVKRPDLFKVVFSRVPVTDMLRFHHFTIGNSWIAEYGVSDIPEDL